MKVILEISLFVEGKTKEEIINKSTKLVDELNQRYDCSAEAEELKEISVNPFCLEEYKSLCRRPC